MKRQGPFHFTGEKRLKRKRNLITPKNAPYFFVSLALLLFLTFTAYPVINTIILSFETRTQGSYHFSGLANYIRLFTDPLFYKSLVNTLVILIIQVPLMLSLALLLAVALNSPIVKMQAFLRSIFFIPSVTSLVAGSVIFLLLLNSNFGFVNYVLSFVHIGPIDWLNDPLGAKMSNILVILWRWTGYQMVIYLAGLQNISKYLYEAASIDGAGKARMFFSITIPQLKPIILFTVVLASIGTMQLFDEPYILTDGGPNNATLTVVFYLYQNGFKYFDFGYASAIGVILIILTAAFSWMQLKIGGVRD